MTTLSELIAFAADRALFSPEDGAPFQAFPQDGHPKLAVLTGSNASGKSVFFRVLASAARSHDNTLAITLSIRERTGAGYSDMAGMRKAMMYGQEDEQSTGATSFKTAETGFRNLVSQAEEGQSTVLMIDEPEMGLSEDYAAAMGQWIAQKTSALEHPNAVGVVVVTHSRALVRRLVEELGATPSFINMDSHQSLKDWLAQTPSRTVEELIDLSRLGRERRRAMDQFLDKRAKPAEEPQNDASEAPAPTKAGRRPRR